MTTRGPWEITKKFEFPKPDGFELAMTVTVKNVSQQAQSGELAVLFPRQVDPTTEQASSFFGGLGNQAQVSCFYGTDYKALVPGKDEGHTTHEGQIAYVGVDLQYFLGVLYPLDGPMQGKCDSKAQPTERIATRDVPALAPARAGRDPEVRRLPRPEGPGSALEGERRRGDPEEAEQDGRLRDLGDHREAAARDHALLPRRSCTTGAWR